MLHGNVGFVASGLTWSSSSRCHTSWISSSLFQRSSVQRHTAAQRSPSDCKEQKDKQNRKLLNDFSHNFLAPRSVKCLLGSKLLCCIQWILNTVSNINRSHSLDELSVKVWKTAWFDYLCNLFKKKFAVKLINAFNVTFTLISITLVKQYCTLVQTP